MDSTTNTSDLDHLHLPASLESDSPSCLSASPTSSLPAPSSPTVSCSPDSTPLSASKSVNVKMTSPTLDTHPIVVKKRGFDIASLVDPENTYSSSSLLNIYNNNNNPNHIWKDVVSSGQQGSNNAYHPPSQLQPPSQNNNSSKKKRKSSPASTSNETGNNNNNNINPSLKLEGLAAQLSASLQAFQSSQQQNQSSPSHSLQEQQQQQHLPSAFKKVDKGKHSPSSVSSSLHSSPSSCSSLFASPGSLPFSLLSSLYNSMSSGGGRALGFLNPTCMPPPMTPVNSSPSLLQHQMSGNCHLSSLFASLPHSHSQPNLSSLSQTHGQRMMNMMMPVTKGGKASHDSRAEVPVSDHGSSCKSRQSPPSTSSSSSSHPHSSPSSSAIPSSLLPFLPPSLAALSFPQTNWCAKCNASFRMTSDLVYHMRSHHKPSAGGGTGLSEEDQEDPTNIGRKKRQDKLKCLICGESFRERHHLTRHMTSHQ